ncbi:MAG: DUF3352 domain-containing protein [Saprospiraceae bacterium]
MNLRNIIIISIIGLSIFLLIFKPYPISRLPFFPISGIEAIPSNAGVCFEMKSLQSFRDELNDNKHLASLKELYVFQQYKRDFGLLENVLKKDSIRHERIIQTPLLSVMQNGGLDAVNFLFILETKSKSEATDFQQWLTTLPDLKITSTTYKNELVYKVEQKNGKSFSFVSFRNLLLIGRYPLLIEDAINQLKVVREPFFKGFMAPKTLGLPESLRVYIRPSNLPLTLLPFLNKKGKKRIDELYDMEELITVNVLLEDDGVSLKGSYPLSGVDNWLKSVQKQKVADRSSLAEILPGNTALVQWLSISELDAYKENSSASQSSNAIEIIEKYFKPWIGNHAALVTTEPYSINLDAENFLVLAAKDADLGEHYLEKLAQAEGEMKAYEYMTYNVRQIVSDDLFHKNIWPGFELKNPFVSFINGYMIAAQSQQALEVWIDKYNAGQTLNNTPTYQNAFTKLDSNAKWWTHFHTDNARQLLVTYLRKEYEPAFNKQFDIVKNNTPVDFILNEKGELNGFVAQQGETKKGTSIFWRTSLAAEIIGTPKVIEYKNSKQFQVLVQDETNTIYLLNSGGEVLWKKALDGPMLSEIQVIDYYKNKQPNFLFNTAGSIYLYNESGVDVGNFPIKLRTKATNGVLAVDFDGLKDYSFFVACRNNKLYGFQKTGRPLEGWPKSGIRRVEQPLSHFQHAGKDFLVVLNTKGKLLVFDKTGDKQFPDIRFSEKFIDPPAFDDIDEFPRIVAITEEGSGRVVNVEGDYFKLNMEVGTNEKVQFTYADMLDDQRKDFAVSSKSHLAAYYYNKEHVFSKSFGIDTENEIDELFSVAVPGKSKAMIGTLCKAKKQIFLYSAKGKKFKNFPLAGTTPFQIIRLHKSGENILVAGNGANIIVYRLR